MCCCWFCARNCNCPVLFFLSISFLYLSFSLGTTSPAGQKTTLSNGGTFQTQNNNHHHPFLHCVNYGSIALDARERDLFFLHILASVAAPNVRSKSRSNSNLSSSSSVDVNALD